MSNLANHITVLSWKPSDRPGSLIGTADLKLGPIEVLRARIIQQEGQALWVSPPQIEWQRPGDTKKSYYPTMRWPREWGEAIAQAVSEAMSDFPSGIVQQRTQPKTEFGREVQSRAGIGGRR